MLTRTKRKRVRLKNGANRIALIASKYNVRYVDAMVAGAKAVTFGAADASLEVFRVPGAFEIPAVAARIADSGEFAAIICLGVVLRGETTHAQHITEAISHALAEIQIKYRLPVIHEVLLLE